MRNFKRKTPVSYEKETPITYEMVTEDVIENGKHLKKVIKKPILEDPNEGLCGSDFSLAAILAVGATDLLKPIEPLSMGGLSTTDSLAITLENNPIN